MNAKPCYSRPHYFFIVPALIAASVLNSQLSTLRAQGTAFTYQGRLNNNGSPAGGSYDFRFRLDADPVGNTILATTSTNAISATNGLFITTIDFGAGLFNGSNYWLEVDVRTNGATFYTALAPLQFLTPTPYAIFANTASNLSGALPAAQLTGPVASGNFSGTYGNTLILSNGGNSFTGSYAGNGANLTNVNAAALNGLNATNFWKTTGNSGTSPATGNYFGTADNQPLEIRANNLRALRIEPNTNGAPNLIGGAAINYVAPGMIGATIAGGGAVSYGGGAQSNSVACLFGSIGGGIANQIQGSADESTISGGGGNGILAGASASTVGGGNGNVIQTNASASTIGGGVGNLIQTNSYNSTIGGGFVNVIQTNAYESTISGGGDNAVQTNAYDSTIGGGFLNVIQPNSYRSTISGGGYSVIQPGAYESTIGGGLGNAIQTNAYDSTIGGGNGNAINDHNCTISGGFANAIQSDAAYSAIGGGAKNVIDDNQSTIGGGTGNIIQPGASTCTIGGGGANAIQPNAYQSTIGGGYTNSIYAGAFDSVIGGGNDNVISNGAYYSTIGGGVNNQVGGAGSTVPGGNGNQAIGVNSFAAGTFSEAVHDGSFVLSDQTYSLFASTAVNQFSARFNGGYRFYTGAASGAQLLAGATSWTTISDRNVKKNFAAVDGQAVLAKLAAVPIQQWNYKWEKDSDVPNIGPMAQDFKKAFYPGRDDKGISTLEFDGVELAAIQGLNEKLTEKDGEIQSLKRQNDSMAARLNDLESAVKALAEKK